MRCSSEIRADSECRGRVSRTPSEEACYSNAINPTSQLQQIRIPREVARPSDTEVSGPKSNRVDSP